jgi:hypothetical protein
MRRHGGRECRGQKAVLVGDRLWRIADRLKRFNPVADVGGRDRREREIAEELAELAGVTAVVVFLFLVVFIGFGLCCCWLCGQATHFAQEVVYYQHCIFVVAYIQHVPELVKGYCLGACQYECVIVLLSLQHFFQPAAQIHHVLVQQLAVVVVGFELIEHFAAYLAEGFYPLIAYPQSYASFLSHVVTDFRAVLYFFRN